MSLSGRAVLRSAFRRRISALSLRRRLVIVLLALLLVSCALIGVATTLALRHFLIDRLDQQLELVSCAVNSFDKS